MVSGYSQLGCSNCIRNSRSEPTPLLLRRLGQIPPRTDCGIQMLLDRACPSVGWNAGNGVVYGAALTPHPDDTAIALLPLRDRDQDPIVQGSVDYMERVAPTLTAPWSLAWAILALAAHRRPIASLSTSLAAL